MEQENFEQWDTDELYMWFTTEHDLMPDEEKLKESGIDGAALAILLDDESQLEEIGLGSPTSRKTAHDAITELLQKYGAQGPENVENIEENVEEEEQEEIKQQEMAEEDDFPGPVLQELPPDVEPAPHDMPMKQEMWLEHLYQNINQYEMDQEPADHRLKVLLYHLHEREMDEPKYQDEASKREALEALARQLKKEGRYGHGVQKIFDAIGKEFLNNSGEQAFAAGLKRLLFEIEPFNISLFRSLAAKTEEQLQKVKDKVILLLLGPTGGGKSTTIQWLCGSKLVKTQVKMGQISLSHIGVAKNGYPEGHDPELERVALSPFSVSETSFIRVIKTVYASGFATAECFICDSPGLEDSRGEELNVANIYGLVQAARVCKKVIPIVVLSKDSMGNRCVSLKKISRNIAGLIHNPEEHMGKLSYLFTKFDSTPAGQELLNSQLREVYMNLNEKDKSDQHYMRFWNAMANKVATPEQILIADPLNKEKSQNVLTKLVNGDKIEEPMEAFQMSLDDKSLNLIKAQIHEDKNSLQKFALPSKKYALIREKLDDIRALVESLTGQVFIQDCFNEIVQVLKDHMNHFYDECKQMTDNAKSSVDALKVEELEQVSKSKGDFSQIFTILEDFGLLEQGGLTPKSFDSLIDALALGYVSELKKLQDKKNGVQNNYLRDSNTQRILSSLAFLAESTGEEKHRQFFDMQKQNVIAYLSEIVHRILSHIEKGSYSEVVSTFNLFNDSKANLEILNQEHLRLEEKLSKGISQIIQAMSTQVGKECRKLKPDSIQNVEDAIRSFEPQWNQLKAASTSELFMTQMQQFEIDLEINTCVGEIQSELDSKYQTSFDQIQRKCLNEEEDIDLSSLGKLENQMILINVMSQSLTAEISKQSNPQQLVNNIQASTQQQFLKHQSNLGLSLMQDKDFDAFLSQLSGLEWLDNMSGEEEFFRSKYAEILAQMKEFEDRQREACKKVYGKSDFCQLIHILMIFQSLGKSYLEQSKQLIKDYKTKITEDWLEKIEQYQSREESNLDLIKCQMYLEFFENFDDQQNIFEFNNQLEQKKKSFYQYLKDTAKKSFAVHAIDSTQAAKEVEDNLEVISEQIKEESQLAIIIDALALKENMLSQIAAKVQQLSLEQMELGLDNDKQRQSELLSKVDSAMSLSKHLDKTRENNIDLMDLRQRVIASLNQGNQKEEEDLFKALEKHNFIEARSLIIAILQGQPIQIQKRAFREIRRTFSQLNERLESSQRRLNNNSKLDDFIRISDDIRTVELVDQSFTVSLLGEVQALCDQCSENKNSNQELVKHLESVYQQVQNAQVALNECATKGKQKLNLTFSRLIEKVDMLIQVKKFNAALEQNQTLSDTEQSLENMLEPDLVEKIKKVDETVTAGIEEAIKFFEQPPDDFDNFLYDSFAEFIDSLHVLKGAHMNAHHSKVDAIKRINRKFINKIEALRKKGLMLQDGLENQELSLIERALQSLTDQQKSVLQAQIESLKQNFAQKKQGRFEQVSQMSKLDCLNYKEVSQFVSECRMNNDAKELQIIEMNMRDQVGPCVVMISDLIESSQTDGMKQSTATFQKHKDGLGATFSFFPQYQSEILDALNKKHSKIKISLQNCLSQDNSVLGRHNSKNQESFETLIKGVKFMREIQQYEMLKDDQRIYEMEQLVTLLEEWGKKQIEIQAQLILNLGECCSFDNNAAVDDDLVKSIIKQIIVQQNIDQLQDIFMVSEQSNTESSNIESKSSPILKRQPSIRLTGAPAFLDQLRGRFQEVISVFDEPFARQDLTTDGEIKALYRKMEMSHRNLFYLGQFESFGIKVNLNHEETTISSNLRSQTQSLLITQIENHTEAMKTSLVNLGDDQLPSQEATAEIDHFSNHLRLFLQVFEKVSNEFRKLGACGRLIQCEFDRIIENRAKVCTQSKNIKSFAQSLVDLKRVSDYCLTFKASLDQKIDEILDNCKKTKQFEINKLSQSIEDTADPSSKSLLEEHQVFKANVIALVNSRIQNPEFGIRYVLENIKGCRHKVPAESLVGKVVDKGINVLGSVVDRLNPFAKPEKEDKPIDTKYLEEQYDSFMMEYGSFDAGRNKFTGLLGEFLRPKPKIQVVRQELLALAQEVKINKEKLTIRPLDYGKIHKILAYIFCIWTIEASESHFQQQEEDPDSSGEKNFLRMPHAAQVIAIMRLLGMGNFKKEPVLTNQLVEVLTGQGKSLIMAVASATLALLGADCYCACYSEYLSKRDFDDFKSLFQHLGVLEKVHYGTMEQLCESVINQRGSIRDQTEHVVGKRRSGKTKDLKNLPIQVLLIDEVDVFFGQSFYGNLYQPSLVVKDECIQNLIKFIWEQRKNNVNYQMVYDSEQFKACLKEVPNFKELLIEGIKDMLFDVKEIDKHKDYIVEKERIGYLNGDQYVFNAQMGYLTQFAYIREHADSSISEDSLKQNLGLRVNCGAYSFAKIPEKFRLILGVTGTLQNVTETQRDIISRKYKILEETYMPSVFGKSNLRYNHKDNFIVVSKKEYWSRIRKEIDTQLQGINGVKNSRAALVIFENERALKEFQLSVHCQEIRTQIKIIAESSGIDQAAQFVKLSTRQGAITLMTRNFGRGTDFSCKDERVNNQGGVAIIQTFLSESQSEDAQIRGRVARQGQDGSYSLVIHADFLQSVKIQEAEVDKYKAEGNMVELFERIMKQLNDNQNESQIQNNQNVEQANQDHEVSEAFLENLYGGDFEKAIQQLKVWNAGKSATGSCKTLILIDATNSMQMLLDQTKSNVQIMLERIKTVLKENGVNGSDILMKIAVYRNYDSKVDLLYQESSWETDAKHLKGFLGKVKPIGGWGKEAMEVGLLRATEEIDGGLSQIFIIGDMPHNFASDIVAKQNGEHGREYWDKKLPGIQEAPVYVEQLKAEGIPIHTLYLQENAKECFTGISSSTGGESYFLDVQDHKSADMLVEVVNVQILKSMKNPDLLASYEKAYGLQFS